MSLRRKPMTHGQIASSRWFGVVGKSVSRLTSKS